MRQDLFVRGVEGLWVDVNIKGHQKVLFGVFYRPLDSGDHIFTLIEHSIGLAVDTAFKNIVILGDFNQDYLKDNNVRRKI